MLSIGAFARLASVSIKTLRFYDSAGVFHPARVASGSGYRYYEIDQLETLRELRLLRTLGFSVDELRTWVQSHVGSAERIKLLLRLRERIEQRLTNDRQRLRCIDRWVHDMTHSLPLSTPAVRSIPSMPALTIRDRVRAASPTIYKMFETGERVAARQQARVAKEPFLLIYDGEYRSQNADIEICIPVEFSSLSAVNGRLVEGAAAAVCLTFPGSYDHAPAAYQAMRSWMQVTGARATGPLREAYLRFGADQLGYRLPQRFLAHSVDEYRTQLQIPIADI